MRKGFQNLSAEQRRAISSAGGKVGGHRWTSEEAKAAAKAPRGAEKLERDRDAAIVKAAEAEADAELWDEIRASQPTVKDEPKWDFDNIIKPEAPREG